MFAVLKEWIEDEKISIQLQEEKSLNGSTIDTDWNAKGLVS